MKTLILSALFLIMTVAATSMAQTVLIPEKNMNVDSYLERCQKSGYICTHDFLEQSLIKKETPLFNDYIENLDLLDDKQRSQITEKTKHILKNEMISMDQFETLMTILDKSLGLEKNKKAEFLKTQILQIKNKLDRLPEEKNQSEYFMVLKKKLSPQQFKDFAVYKSILMSVRINPVSYQTNQKAEEFLLQGSCSSPEISPDFQQRFLSALPNQQSALRTQLVFNEDCSFTKSINASLKTTGDFITEYKKPLLWTAVAAAAVFFLTKNYEVEFK